MRGWWGEEDHRTTEKFKPKFNFLAARKEMEV